MNIIFDRGIHLPDFNLWLDSRRKRSYGYISHAHQDHFAPHLNPLMTPATFNLVRDLLPHSNPHLLDFGETLETSSYSLSLHPAGHCLGSAQVLVKSKLTGQSILYTGDIKTRYNPTCQPIEAVPCDILVIESTFGSPMFRFPDQKDVLQQLFQTIQRWLNLDITPVVLAYKTGKAQEILHNLQDNNLDVVLEPSIYEITRRYEESGIKFPRPFRKFDGKVNPGEILIIPPGRKSKEILKVVPNKRTIAMSGWAAHSSTRNRVGANLALPYSDHADFDDLLSYVKTINPKKVYTVHGFSDLAQELKTLGYEANTLVDSTSALLQLNLL